MKVIKYEEPTAVIKNVSTFLEEIKFSKINNIETAEKVRDVVKKVKQKEKEIKATEKAITAPLNLAKKNIKDLFRPVLTKIEGLIKEGKEELLIFTEEQERIRQLEIIKLEKIQREKEEEQEKIRQLEIAELEKLQKKEVNKKEKEKQEKLIEELKSTPAPVEDVVVVIPEKKTAGFSIVTRWKYKVSDFSKLPDKYKIENSKMLQSIATATKGTIDIPGVEFFKIKGGRI